MRLAAIAILATVAACAGGVPHAKYEARVDENARLREANSSLERNAGENRELRRRVAVLEAENAQLRAESSETRAAPVPVAPPPERPPPAAEAGAEAAASAAGLVDARVIQLEVKSGGIQVTVNRGERDGVERGWTLELVDDSGKPVARARGRVSYVGPTYARAMMRVRIKVARRFAQARLTPP